MGVIILIGLIFIFRLFYIQVIDDSYKLDARNQAFRYKTEFPVRGYIFDRNNKLLVYNEAAYDLMVLPKEIKNLDTTDFCTLLGITKQLFLIKRRKDKNWVGNNLAIKPVLSIVTSPSKMCACPSHLANKIDGGNSTQ